MRELADVVAPVEGSHGFHRFVARSEAVLEVRWRWLDEGRRVDVEALQVAGFGAGQRQRAILAVDGIEPRRVVWVFGAPDQPVDITLAVRRRNDPMRTLLWANVPLTSDTFFSDSIGEYRPEPQPPTPPVPPVPPAPDVSDDVIIEALPGAADLLPFLWLRPLSRREADDALRRYTAAPGAPRLPFYEQLSKITGASAASLKQQVATTFCDSKNPPADSTFIADPAALPEPNNRLAAMRMGLMAIEGPKPIDQLVEAADAMLGRPLKEYLADNTFQTVRGNVWQSIAALALIGTSADGSLAAQLVDMLRTIHYLTALGANDLELREAQVRREMLRATPTLPDYAAAGLLEGPPPPVEAQWSLLGVGQLERVRHHLRGYAPGELAEVVNLMPRERQERHERSIIDSERQRQQQDERSRSDTVANQSEAASELADTLKEVMCTEGLVRNLKDVTPQYSELSLMLSGQAAGSDARLQFDDENVARLVQRMSEKAAQKMADRVSGQRSEVWREWREHRESQCIDNGDGARLVGIYRWVDRLMQVWLKGQGRRLVLAVQIETPAKTWVSQVAAGGPLPLIEPEPLPTSTKATWQGYTQVTPTNYQSWGAQYGLSDLPAPPADTFAVSAQFNRVTLADRSQLRVPDGYVVASGSATIALADNTFGLAVNVGTVKVYQRDGSAPAPDPVKLAVPDASEPTKVADLSVTVPARPSAFADVVSLTDSLKGSSGAIAVTVISDAPLFGVGIELSCERIQLPAPAPAPAPASAQAPDPDPDPTTKAVVDPLLVDWQMRVYNRLLSAYQDRTREYEAQLRLRIAAASAGHTDQVQRETLKNQCLAILTKSSQTSDAQTLAGMLEWSAMSWQYDAPITGTSPYPADAPASRVFTEPASERLFRRFLDAQRATVLLPVRAGVQTELFYALQWQPRWPSPPVPRSDYALDVPVAQSTVPLLEEQRCGDCGNDGVDARHRAWTLRLPLPLIYLQEGDALPRFDVPAAAESWRADDAPAGYLDASR